MQELYKILPAYGGVYDAYISQNRFWGPRSVSRLAQLSALYADLDYYKVPTLAEMHPLGVLDLAFEALEKDKVPYPSFAVAQRAEDWLSPGGTIRCHVTFCPGGGFARRPSIRR